MAKKHTRLCSSKRTVPKLSAYLAFPPMIASSRLPRLPRLPHLPDMALVQPPAPNRSSTPRRSLGTRLRDKTARLGEKKEGNLTTLKKFEPYRRLPQNKTRRAQNRTTSTRSQKEQQPRFHIQLPRSAVLKN